MLAGAYGAEEFRIAASCDDGTLCVRAEGALNVAKGADDLLGKGRRDAVLGRLSERDDEDLTVPVDAEVLVRHAGKLVCLTVAEESLLVPISDAVFWVQRRARAMLSVTSWESIPQEREVDGGPRA